MKICILGTEYDYRETTEKEDVALCGNDGYCDPTAKIIAIETEHNQNDPNSVGDFGAVYRKVKRHEVIHAFFYESGLRDYAENEQLVDWIATQAPKMIETFKKLDAL